MSAWPFSAEAYRGRFKRGAGAQGSVRGKAPHQRTVSRHEKSSAGTSPFSHKDRRGTLFLIVRSLENLSIALRTPPFLFFLFQQTMLSSPLSLIALKSNSFPISNHRLRNCNSFASRRQRSCRRESLVESDSPPMRVCFCTTHFPTSSRFIAPPPVPRP